MQNFREGLRDPRHLQIAVLTALLGYGIVELDFEVAPTDALLILGSALGAQFLFSGLRDQPFDPRSPLISALSLCLLLRAADPELLCLAAIIAVASKFILRVNDKHVFNPTNFAIVVLLVTTDSAWVSPGQWGTQALVAAVLVLAGSMVLRRAERSDITFAFLLFWAVILFGRSFWLGEPWTIPVHRLESGGLLLFAFFMLSDPRTTPDSRIARIGFAGAIALVAAFIQFVLFEPNALLVALVVSAPMVPLLDWALPGIQFGWPSALPTTALRTEPTTMPVSVSGQTSIFTPSPRSIQCTESPTRS